MKDKIEKYLKYMDPALVAGKESDFYSDIASRLATKSFTNLADFSENLFSALTDAYSEDWLQNKDCSKDEIATVIFAQLADSKTSTESAVKDTAWADGSGLRFAGFKSTSNAQGKTEYYEKDSDNGFEFKFGADIPEFHNVKRIQLGEVLGVVVDECNRLLYPTHLIDNVFLGRRPTGTVNVPTNIAVAHVYLLAPRSEDVEDRTYYKVEALDNVLYDENQNIVQFGSLQDGDCFEVAHGFTVCISDGVIQGAAIRLG